MTKSLQERRQLVTELLRPDELRNHRISEGLPISTEVAKEITEIARLCASFNDAMSSISNMALHAETTDPTMKQVRIALGTEPLFQAKLRGELTDVQLQPAELIKSDLILTERGVKIAEIEPGKVRGVGYGYLTRQQGEPEKGLGIGIDKAAQGLSGPGMQATFVLSEEDKFHEPEISMLDREIAGIDAMPQRRLQAAEGGVLDDKGRLVGAAVMMSAFRKGAGIVDELTFRDIAHIASDRRSDLEAKGALALLHNAGQDPALEELLQEQFGSDDLTLLRGVVPLTLLPTLYTREGMAEIATKVEERTLNVFLKPVAASGTRGIITPDKTQEIAEILRSHRLARRYVIQIAEPTIPIEMTSRDLLSTGERTDTMNIRITLHSGRHGEIVETSVVGSPHAYLAHGGKSSVITNLEVTS